SVAGGEEFEPIAADLTTTRTPPATSGARPDIRRRRTKSRLHLWTSAFLPGIKLANRSPPAFGLIFTVESRFHAFVTLCKSADSLVDCACSGYGSVGSIPRAPQVAEITGVPASAVPSAMCRQPPPPG